MNLDKYKAEFHRKTWGFEAWAANSEKYCGKLLHVEAGLRCSLHYHVSKDETFFLHTGTVIILLRDKQGNDSEVRLWPGDCLHIAPGQMHQIIGGEVDSDLFEFSTQHFEEDSYRVERGTPEKKSEK